MEDDRVPAESYRQLGSRVCVVSPSGGLETCCWMASLRKMVVPAHHNKNRAAPARAHEFDIDITIERTLQVYMGIAGERTAKQAHA